jgi:hypothetical protein
MRPPDKTSKAAHELGQRQVKSESEDLLGAEARLLLAGLQIGNEWPAQPRMNGKVRLGPTPLFAEFSNTLPESYADILSYHAISMAVFFGLHFAYRIQLRSREIVVAVLTFGMESCGRQRSLADNVFVLSIADSLWGLLFCR